MKTQPISRFAMALTILTLASLACTITLKSTPTPSATNTPAATATLASPATSPPNLEDSPQSQSVLSILACTTFSDVYCPEGYSTIFDFFPNQTLEYETEYSSGVVAETQVLFDVGWCVLYEDLLQTNLDNMEFVFDIDGESFVHLLQGTYYTSNDGATPPSDTYCYSVSGIVSGWEVGRTYRIAFGFFILSDIDDGWYLYPPTNYTRTYLLMGQ